MELRLSGSLNHTGETATDHIANNCLVDELPAFINDFLGPSRWLVYMLLLDHRLDLPDSL